ncbi:MAG: 30S ribosomal protein S12 methylthiotransferase RimO [Candidatus Omnitrophica bacterium]|nr:30S ribosomal protein S12 methylthiotransferase RimO [Candidatus Omnitrophota bacterium]
MIKGIKTTSDFKKERLSTGQKVGMINLGCARNLVDAQGLLANLKKKGHRVVDVQESDVVIVNTCSFIEEAKKESIDTILDLIELKKKGKIKKVIVAGCLAQRYSKELTEELKDIDAIIGAQKLERDAIPNDYSLTPKHFAYVKISESCYNQCSFCIIPKLKGKFISRTMESIIEEVKRLDEQGVKEINIIGQDITAYGMDLYREYSLAKLLRKITKVIKNVQWIRLLYAFPAHVTDELIDTIAQEERICKYIDMPLQHISDNLLSSMNRNITTKQTRVLVNKIRSRIPQGSLRTTFIVGMPGETKENFDELTRFVQEVEFEKVGVFLYSKEEETPAYSFPKHVADSVKRERMHALMQVQKKISKTKQKKFIGTQQRVLIDEKSNQEKALYLGRTEFDAPEVDGIVYIQSENELKVGEMVNVEIVDAYEYDLVGRLL